MIIKNAQWICRIDGKPESQMADGGIVFDHQRIEVNEPDFQAMQAVDTNGANYHWNGSFNSPAILQRPQIC